MILKINPPFINLVRLSAILSLNIGYSNPDISKAQFDLELVIRKRSGIIKPIIKVANRTVFEKNH